ncbi:oocyte zinc finger protein XlCOF15-like [Ornithodoros turicata]|uniref:oocyte zinc finger protein XlCOF15-like n=1 Tax=Ornithodoros turicata TaxID=34597 RepID=UPI0031399E08
MSSCVRSGEERTPLFKCIQCALVFVSEEFLVEHQRSRQHYRAGKRRCRFCDYTSDHMGSIKRHEVTHTGEKPFVCQVCSKGFTRKMSLEKHVSAVHEGKRMYRCATCGDTFQQKHHLQAHESVHSNDRPHVCNVCGAKFKLKQYLGKHVRLHAGCRGLQHLKKLGFRSGVFPALQ